MKKMILLDLDVTFLQMQGYSTMADDCVFQALAWATDESVEDLKKLFDYGKHLLPDGRLRPPSIHEVFDYILDVGGALTPIHRRPQSSHLGLTLNDLSEAKAKERWESYISAHEGLLIGHRINSERGHMAYSLNGRVHESNMSYPYQDCLIYNFNPHMFLVLTWQA